MAELLHPLAPWRSLWQHRDLLRILVKRNIQQRYKGSLLGLAWMFATPLLMLAVYTFVFSAVFEARWGRGVEASRFAFAMIMLCGLAVFNIVSESLQGAHSVIVGNPNYVKKVVFPLEVLPIASVLTAVVFGLVWFGILVAGIAVSLGSLSAASLALPLILVPLVLVCCGLCWFLASVTVFFRDAPHAVGVALQVLFFLTPIIYGIEMVPAPFRAVIRLNPLTGMVEAVRDVLIYGAWPSCGVLAGLMLVALCVFQLGFVWFMKTRRGFADVL
jgi:lipopolysaccharide transport system permease protein